jgi:hypothetical protein
MTVTELFVASIFYNDIIEIAESPIEAKRYARKSLYYKARAIVEFDRENDRSVKQNG